MLQSMGSQRVRHDWVTEQQQHRGFHGGSDGKDSVCSAVLPIRIPSGRALGVTSCLPYIFPDRKGGHYGPQGLTGILRVKDNLGIYFPLSTVPGFTSFGGLAYSWFPWWLRW